MTRPPPKRTANRGPVAIVAKVPLTADEHVELVTVATLERASYAETMRRAMREYAERKRR